MIKIFSNREIAVGIWLILFIVWGGSYQSVRIGFLEVLKAFFIKPIVIIFSLMLIYVSIVIWLLSMVGLWDFGQMKNTVLWGISVAAVTMFRINSISEDDHYFKKSILDNLKIIVALEFVINVYSLSLWIELIIVPFFAFLGGMLAIAELNEKHRKVEKLLNGILVGIGFMLLSYAAYKIYNDITSFATFRNLKDFALPPIMSISYLPFVYFIALFMTYEVLFVRLSFFAKDPVILRHVKFMTVRIFNINLSSLKLWAKHISKLDFSNKDKINSAIYDFKNSN